MKPFDYKIPAGTKMRPVRLVKPPQHEEKAYKAFYLMTATTEMTITSCEDWYIRKTDLVTKFKMDMKEYTFSILTTYPHRYAIVLLRNVKGSVATVKCMETQVNAFIVARKNLERI